MIGLCDYCGLTIQNGQRFVAICGNDLAPDDPKARLYGVAVKAIYHINCDRQRRREVPRQGGSEDTEKFGVITSSKVDFLPGEPVFLIRATDPFAPHAVLDYARRAVEAGCTKEHVDAAFDHAMRVSEWQRNNPEKVKSLPD